MKKVITTIVIVAVICFILALIIDSFCNRFPSYVLLKNGIKSSDIILSTEAGTPFKIYLYKKKINEDTYIGLINLFKTTAYSKKWKIYTQESKLLSKEDIKLFTYYSIPVNGRPKGITVMGGYSTINKGENIKIKVGEYTSVEPTQTKVNENGGIYFLHTFDSFIEKIKDIAITKEN